MKAPKFTPEECSSLLCEGYAGDYSVVKREVVYVDREKNSTDVEIVIQKEDEDIYWKSEFNESVWIRQNEYNAEQPWEQVKAKKKTVTTFE